MGGVPHAHVGVPLGGAVGPSFMGVESVELGPPGTEVLPDVEVGDFYPAFLKYHKKWLGYLMVTRARSQWPATNKGRVSLFPTKFL